MTRRMSLFLIVLESLGVVLSSITGFLGTVPLMVLRRVLGSKTFILIQVLLCVGLVAAKLPVVWIPFAVCASLVSTYVFLEEKGVSLFSASLFSVLSTSLVSAGLLWLWVTQQQGLEFQTWLTTSIDNVLLEVEKVQPGVKLSTTEILRQIPSVGIILISFALWFGLLFDSRLVIVVPGKEKSLNYLKSLREFQVPTWMIWILIPTLLFAFVDLNLPYLKGISLNILNLVLLVYFFQGLCITALAFDKFRVGPIFRAILYVILVTQLFLFISVLGVLDYWLNFKNRLSNTQDKQREKS